MARDRDKSTGEGSRPAGIPLGLLRRCRAVISRKTDSLGKAVWVAELRDLPSCRATGSSRIEALDRVRELAERRGDAFLPNWR